MKGLFVSSLQVLRMMVGVNISDEQLGSIADRTIQEADTNGDNSISFNEFIKASYWLRGHLSLYMYSPLVYLCMLLCSLLFKLTPKCFY